MSTQANGRWHVNDSFDQLGFLELGHRHVPPFELSPAEPVAGLERRDYALGAG